MHRLKCIFNVCENCNSESLIRSQANKRIFRIIPVRSQLSLNDMFKMCNLCPDLAFTMINGYRPDEAPKLLQFVGKPQSTIKKKRKSKLK